MWNEIIKGLAQISQFNKNNFLKIANEMLHCWLIKMF